MTTKLSKDCAIIWQEVVDGVGEPALLIKTYSDVIEIAQEGRHITLNHETVKELTKVLKTLQPK